MGTKRKGGRPLAYKGGTRKVSYTIAEDLAAKIADIADTTGQTKSSLASGLLAEALLARGYATRREAKKFKRLEA